MLILARNKRAGHVFHVYAFAGLHRGELGIRQRALRVIIDAPRPGILIVARHPHVRRRAMPARGGMMVCVGMIHGVMRQ